MQASDILVLAASSICHLAFLVILFIIARLSRIMGAALKKKPVHRLMYPAYAFLVGGGIFPFVGDSLLLLGLLCDVIGFILGVLVTFYYWNWLPGDLARS